METADLAQLMADGAGNQKRSENGQYYMMNINHPVIAALKRRYCDAKNIVVHGPMSDAQRFEFELWLLQPSIRSKVEEIVLSGIRQVPDQQKQNSSTQIVEA